MKAIAQENMGTHIENELKKEALKDLIDPLKVWITRWDKSKPRIRETGFLYSEGRMMWG